MKYPVNLPYLLVIDYIVITNNKIQNGGRFLFPHILMPCLARACTYLIVKISRESSIVVMLTITFYLCRFKSDEERTPVYRIVDETFPHLLNIFSRLVQIVNPSLEIADLIKLICKIFWSSIYVCFLSSRVFLKWRNLFSQCYVVDQTLLKISCCFYWQSYCRTCDYYYLLCSMCSFFAEVELWSISPLIKF
jgi:hypothetical protein